MHIYVLSYYFGEEEDDWDYVVEAAFATENLAKARMHKLISEWIDEGHGPESANEDLFVLNKLRVQGIQASLEIRPMQESFYPQLYRHQADRYYYHPNNKLNLH